MNNQATTIDARSGFTLPVNLKTRIELAYQCNLRCRMCDFSLAEELKEKRAGGSLTEMAKPVFQRICAEILPHTQECILGIRAEPMTSRHFKERLRMIAAQNVPNIQIHTNGTLMSEEISHLICELGINTIIFSVDGLTKETYEYIRPNAKFDKLMTNIRRLGEIRGNSPFPIIQWNFVMMRRNLRELPGLIDLAADMQIQVVHAFHLVFHKDLNIAGESCSLCPEETNAITELAKARATERNVILHIPPPIATEKQAEAIPTNTNNHLNVFTSGPVCGFPWQEVVINQNGHIFPCVFWHIDPPLGDLSKQSFWDIWNGEAYRNLRCAPTHKIPNFSCNHCPVAASKLGKSENIFQTLP